MKSPYLAADLDWQGMHLIIEEHLKESEVIDFKSSLYDLTVEEQQDEFAKDVSAFANNRGGLLLLGIKDVNNAAESVSPVKFSDSFESRCQQVILSLVSPRVPLNFKRIPQESDPDSGILIIEIPRSSNSPHGCQNKGRIRYPMRTGMDTRYLNEIEVSQMYKSRFIAGEKHERELTDLELKINLNLSPTVGWLMLTLVPKNKGTMQIENETFEKYKLKYENKFLEAPIPLFQTGRVKVGYSQFIVESQVVTVPTSTFGFNLFGDGRGFGYVAISPTLTRGEFFTFPKKYVAAYGIPMVEILIQHALNTGAFGEFAIQLDFRFDGETSFGLSSPAPFSGEARLDGELVRRVQPAMISFDGQDLSESFKIRMKMCKSLFSIFLQNFGFTDFEAISDSGDLNTSVFSPNYQAMYFAWEAGKIGGNA